MATMARKILLYFHLEIPRFSIFRHRPPLQKTRFTYELSRPTAPFFLFLSKPSSSPPTSQAPRDHRLNDKSAKSTSIRSLSFSLYTYEKRHSCHRRLSTPRKLMYLFIRFTRYSLYIERVLLRGISRVQTEYREHRFEPRL